MQVGTGARVGPGAILLLGVAPRRCRMFASPMSTQTALRAILSMVASAWTPPTSLGCQSFFLNWVQRTVDVAVPQLPQHWSELNLEPNQRIMNAER